MEEEEGEEQGKGEGKEEGGEMKAGRVGTPIMMGTDRRAIKTAKKPKTTKLRSKCRENIQRE